MIVSYRDKRTRKFAAGKRVKAFSGIERSAHLKLDRHKTHGVKAMTSEWRSGRGCL
jgi:plasmid maintenance system killer protein